MKSVTALEKTKSIAIGGFDGMHIAHQHLFEELCDDGVVVVIDNGYSNITPRLMRQRYTKHKIFFYNLDEIKDLDAQGFIERLYKDFPLLENIVVGYDFYFGKNRSYSHDDIKRYFKGRLKVVDEVCIDGESVHSRVIREYIKKGDIAHANRLLGHNYTIAGSVVKGQGIGAKELFATINLNVEGFILPSDGVYASFTKIDDDEHLYASVSFLGDRKSTDGSYAIETHIIEQEVEVDKSCEVSFLKFLRENKKFDSLTELKQAIAKDIQKAKKITGDLAL